MTVRTTDRWRGVVALTILAAAVGILSKSPGLLVVAGIGIGYAVYPRLVPPPDDSIAVNRSIDPAEPRPGELVHVELEVMNSGSSWLSDIRIVDGVPGPLEVVGGRPRAATALGPGQTYRIRYEVLAVEGRHRFDAATVISRDIAGARECVVHPADHTILACAAHPPNPTLTPIDTGLPGQIPIDAGGTGIEFYQTRSYQPGDPVGRIDWRTLARTGNLTTIESRAERQSVVIICVDWQGTPDQSRLTAAADQLTTAVLDAGHRVGLASVDGVSMWVSPGAGRDQLRAIRRTLDGLDTDTVPSETLLLDDDREQGLAAGRRLARRCNRPGVQIVLASSLETPAAVPVARYVQRSGIPVMVVSPAASPSTSLGGRIATIDRSNRIDGLRRAGIPVVDWATDEHLWHAFRRRRGTA